MLRMTGWGYLAGLSLVLGLAVGRTAVSADHAARFIKLYSVKEGKFIMSPEVNKTDEEWKKLLSAEQFYVTRKKGTEPAYTGKYWNNHAKGIYRCVCCGNDLFSSETKFESGTGWPSFWAPVQEANVKTTEDNTFFMRRTEAICPRCGSHLGHVFKDGPEPTHLRYCINSAALKFEAK